MAVLSKSLYRTLSAVDIIFSLLTFLINTSRYTSNTTSTSLLHEASYSKLPIENDDDEKLHCIFSPVLQERIEGAFGRRQVEPERPGELGYQ